MAVTYGVQDDLGVSVCVPRYWSGCTGGSDLRRAE